MLLIICECVSEPQLTGQSSENKLTLVLRLLEVSSDLSQTAVLLLSCWSDKVLNVDPDYSYWPIGSWTEFIPVIDVNSQEVQSDNMWCLKLR